jgi:dihydrofolate reductase / thymidylate synthase
MVVGMDEKRGIGANGKLPWPRLAADMRSFKSETSTTKDPSLCNAVVMGRATYESIPPRFRPLQGRRNIVLSGAATLDELKATDNDNGNGESESDLIVARSLKEAVRLAVDDVGVESVMIVGGERPFREALQTLDGELRVDEIVLTRVHAIYGECDRFLCEWPRGEFERVGAVLDVDDEAAPYSIERLRRRPHDEQQYLDAVAAIVERGNERIDRTGVGTRALFGMQMRFSLRDNAFPLLTTKRVFWRGVVEELLWFVAGCTDASKLAERRVHIWDANGSREFLDSRGLVERAENDLGPVYGFQWRHFGAKYVDKDADYSGQGVDQLAQCIETIRSNPTDRRIIMSAWNPVDLGQMALPPCHMFCQFFVADGQLSCLMCQRSCDMGLGVPFNIASYALLTRMIAQCCNLEPGEFIHTLGDAHVYLSHIEPLFAQLERQPRRFPTLAIDPSVANIDDFSADHFQLRDYRPYPSIKMQMAV